MTTIQALLLFAAALAVCALAALSQMPPAPWLINETQSVPPGLYERSPALPTLGAMVAIAPPREARIYLASLGAPSDARLLKRVAAGPGDFVCREGDRLTGPWGEVIALRLDRRGRALPVWRGCRRLQADELLVLGDSAISFDSRYFGPVRLSAVDGVYRAVLPW